MMPFLIFIGIILFISLISFIIFLSTLEIEVENFVFDSNNKRSKKLEDYLIYIKLKFVNKITWLKIKIDYKKIKKYKLFNNKILKKLINFKDMVSKNQKEIFKREIPEGVANYISSNYLKYIKELDIKLKKIHLDMKINVLDAMFTSLIVPLISTFLSIIVANTMEKYNNEDCKYIISPIYSEKMEAIINLNCIINVKIVHIINIVYMLFKKRSVNYDERTSNRRAYVCSNE